MAAGPFLTHNHVILDANEKLAASPCFLGIELLVAFELRSQTGWCRSQSDVSSNRELIMNWLKRGKATHLTKL